MKGELLLKVNKEETKDLKEDYELFKVGVFIKTFLR
jgi:hypothetical protein